MTIADQIVNTLTVGDLPLLISRFHVLPLIILTIFFGICVSLIGEPAKPVVEWMNAMSLVCYKMGGHSHEGGSHRPGAPILRISPAPTASTC